MAYWTDEELVRRAERVPERPLNKRLLKYVQDIRAVIDGEDDINIPSSHRNIMRGENHEGSIRLNERVRQLAAWFGGARPRFSAEPSGPGDTVQEGASLMERFARTAERQLSRGTPLHHWRQECLRDLAEVGWCAFLQTSRREYYVQAQEHQRKMADGSRLSEVVVRRRIDPATLAIEEQLGGGLQCAVLTTERHLGELALRIGIDEAKRMLGYFDIGESIDPSAHETWDISVQVREVWGPENGALIFVGAAGSSALRSGVVVSDLPAGERVYARWTNYVGRVPVYIAKVGPQPWHSPLDSMYALTNERNFWATMLDIQASGAIFRHWQLKEQATGNDVTNVHWRDNVPERLLYDLSKPPPDMGPGTEWALAPFEMHDVIPRYTQIREDHERAGASVARLHGEQVNQNTPVGTADFIDDMAQREFGDWIEAMQVQIEQAWTDLFYWLKYVHKDAVFVVDKMRDADDPTKFLSTALTLSAADIVTEDVKVTLDNRSRLSQIADYRRGVEMQKNGDIDYRSRVERGLVPDVEDADAELAAIYVSQSERIRLETRLRAQQIEEAQNLGLMQPAMPDPAPNIAGGPKEDARGTGTQRGPNNVSDTALAAGATDLLRSA